MNLPTFKALAVCAVAAALTALSGCSARSLYQFTQEQGRQECELQPIALQESCRAQYEMSYREYERLRNQEGRTEKR